MITATQGARIASACTVCGGVLVRDVGQFVDRGQLHWGVEGHCGTCSDGWCETGVGPAPEEIRRALLAEHGAVRLRVAERGASPVPVLRALREVWEVPIAEARRLAAELNGPGLTGSSVEMVFLAEGLRRRSVATVTTPADGHPTV